MYKEVPGLVLYRDLGQDSILYCMADIFEAWEKKTSTKEELVTRIYQQIKRLLRCQMLLESGSGRESNRMEAGGLGKGRLYSSD